MKIQQLHLTVRDLVAGYHDDREARDRNGGKLDIHAPITAWGDLEV